MFGWRRRYHRLVGDQALRGGRIRIVPRPFSAGRQNQGQQQWVDSWPNTALGAQPSDDPPLAVEVILETEAEGRITRLFRVPG